MTAPKVLILTALFDELMGLRRCLEHRGIAVNDRRSEDGYPYHTAELVAEDGAPIHLTFAVAPDMGESSMATTATAFALAHRPTLLAMCGICAGRRGRVRLGDVVLADRLFSYDHGKLIATLSEDGERHEDLFRDIQTYNLRRQWRIEAEYLRSTTSWRSGELVPRPLALEAQLDWLLLRLLSAEEDAGPTGPSRDLQRHDRCPDWAIVVRLAIGNGLCAITAGRLQLTDAGREAATELTIFHPDGRRIPETKVAIGAMATGKTVREDDEIFAVLERFERNAVALEMEGAALGYVSEYLEMPAVVVKSVVDHADPDKDDRFREYACWASAAFLIAFICRVSNRGAADEDETVTIVIDGLSPAQLASVYQALASVVRDPRLRVMRAFEGSLVLEIAISVWGARNLMRAYENGTLENAIGAPVRDIYFGPSSADIIILTRTKGEHNEVLRSERPAVVDVVGSEHFVYERRTSKRSYRIAVVNVSSDSVDSEAALATMAVARWRPSVMLRVGVGSMAVGGLEVGDVIVADSPEPKMAGDVDFASALRGLLIRGNRYSSWIADCAADARRTAEAFSPPLVVAPAPSIRLARLAHAPELAAGAHPSGHSRTTPMGPVAYDTMADLVGVAVFGVSELRATQLAIGAQATPAQTALRGLALRNALRAVYAALEDAEVEGVGRVSEAELRRATE